MLDFALRSSFLGSQRSQLTIVKDSVGLIVKDVGRAACPPLIVGDQPPNANPRGGKLPSSLI